MFAPRSLSRTASAAALATVLALPAPALAQWQEIRIAPVQNLVDRCSTTVLRAADNRALRVAAGASVEIEVLGHGIDLTRDFSFDGGSVNWRGSYGGAANVGRGCGAIGSVKLQLAVSHAYPASAATAQRDFTLRIGDQTIRVTAILPSRFQTLKWDPGSFRQYDGPLETERPQGAPTPSGGALPPQSPPIVRSGPSCTQAQTCGGGGTTGFVQNSGPLTGGGNATDNEARRSLAACIMGRGGDARLDGRRLEIMLPDDRGAVRDCLTAGSFAVTGQDYEQVDIVGQSAQEAPRIAFSTTAGADAVVSPSLDPERAKFSLNRDFAAQMVGVRTYRVIATNFAQRSQALDVRVQSVVPYGVTRIAPATALAATGQLGVGRFDAPRPAGPSAALAFDIDLAPSDTAARPLRWELRDAQGRPTAAASCFAVGAGTLAPAAGAGRVSLSVPRVSEGACAGASFTLVVAPEGRMGHALYTESLPFTLR